MFLYLETVNENFNFEYGDYDYDDSDDNDRREQGSLQRGGCSAVFMGQMMYFGGYPNTRQYSIIHDCKIDRHYSEMPFDFYRGACNSFMEPTPKVLLCFNYREDFGFTEPYTIYGREKYYYYGNECHM